MHTHTLFYRCPTLELQSSAPHGRACARSAPAEAPQQRLGTPQEPAAGRAEPAASADRIRAAEPGRRPTKENSTGLSL